MIPIRANMVNGAIMVNTIRQIFFGIFHLMDNIRNTGEKNSQLIKRTIDFNMLCAEGIILFKFIIGSTSKIGILSIPVLNF